MNKHHLLFLFFIFMSSIYSEGGEFDADTEKQNFETNSQYLADQFTHMFPNYSVRSEPFESENPKVEKKSTLVKTFIFENRNAGEHMFNLEVKCALSNHNYSMTINETKVNPIKKHLGVINWNEFNYQMPVYQIAIQNALMNNAFWRKSDMKIWTFSDVVSNLSNKISSLELISNSNNDSYNNSQTFTYQMMIQDSYIGTLTLYYTNSENPEDIGDMSLTGNYIMHVGFSIAKNNEIQAGELTFPMITKKGDQFFNVIKTAVEAIDSKNQFNSFSALVSFVKKYYLKAYPEIVINMIDNDYKEQGQYPYQYGTLSFENNSMEIYIGSNFNNGVSQYTVMVDYPNNNFSNPIVNTTFYRCSNEVLSDILNYAAANNTFVTIYGDIMGMFTSGFAEISQNQNIEENPIFKSLEYFDNSASEYNKGVSNGDVKCVYKKPKKEGKITITVSSTSKDTTLTKSFLPTEYDRNNVWNMMNLFFQSIKGYRRRII